MVYLVLLCCCSQFEFQISRNINFSTICNRECPRALCCQKCLKCERMGCISSKAITPSLSIKEELSHGFQSRSLLWEELLITSNRANDQLLAFVKNPSTKHLVHVWDLINAEPEAQGDSSKSTSFHTVEECDALLERIHGTRSLECSDDCFPWDEDEIEEESIAVESGENCEAGWKRKAVARGLKSLDISAPDMARMKQGMVVQAQIYSPGTYITPKFGSYIDPVMREARRKENDVFSPELVAAFEDYMQQLQVEEDSILRHMTAALVDDEMENEVSNM